MIRSVDEPPRPPSMALSGRVGSIPGTGSFEQGRPLNKPYRRATSNKSLKLYYQSTMLSDIEILRFEPVLLLALKLSSIATLNDTQAKQELVAKEELTLSRDSFAFSRPHGDMAADFIARHGKLRLQSINSADLSLLIPLLLPTELLLSFGGDDRLTIDFAKTKVNKYFSSTVARPGIIRRGSCTCSTITTESFEVADSLRLQILSQAVLAVKNITTTSLEVSIPRILHQEFSTVRKRLAAVFGLQYGNSATKCEQIVLFPSGSDAEFLPVLVALVRSCSLLREAQASKCSDGTNSKSNSVSADCASRRAVPKVFNVVTAAGEVGSGTPNAASGRHFSPLAPRGNSVGNNDFLAGLLPDTVQLMQYKPRASADGSICFDEAKIKADILAALDADESSCSVALLHVVLGSKTGLIYPGLSIVKSLTQRYPRRVIIVVDACQLRCRLQCVAKYTNSGYISLVTGSKFFAGPPFSGAVVLPAEIAEEIETHCSGLSSSSNNNDNEEVPLPWGLADYISAYDVPESMPSFRQFLREANKASSKDRSIVEPSQANVGLLLRWHCALYTMEAYQRLDAVRVRAKDSRDLVNPVTEFTKRWARGLRQLVCSLGEPYLRLLLEAGDTGTDKNVDGGNADALRNTDDTIDDDRIGSRRGNGLCGDIEGDTPGGANTIISMEIFVPRGDSQSADTSPLALIPLGLDDCKAFHHKLTLNLDDSVFQDPQYGDMADCGASKINVGVMIGQPVKLSEATGKTVLRIALGADMVIDALSSLLNDNSDANPVTFDFEVALNRTYDTDKLVIEKMCLMAKYWGRVSSSSVNVKNYDFPNSGLVRLASIVKSGYDYDSDLMRRMLSLDNDLQLSTEQFSNSNKGMWSKNTTGVLQRAELSKALHLLKKEPSGIPDVCILYDLDSLHFNFAAVHAAFNGRLSSSCLLHTETYETSGDNNNTTDSSTAPCRFLHCFAIKSCPLSFVLHRAVQAGLGLEAASIVEVKHALQVGCPPARVMFDSPCKTVNELSFALQKGVHVNANSLVELAKIKTAIEALRNRGISCDNISVGLRVNPLVGAGDIAALSTATAASKFGVPIYLTPISPSSSAAAAGGESSQPTSQRCEAEGGEETKMRRSTDGIVELFVQHEFLSAIMCHVGSQGMSLDSMVEGVSRIVTLADRIDARCASSTTTTAAGHMLPRIKLIDIGGGLAVDYDSDEARPSFERYATRLRALCPTLFAPPSSSTTTPGRIVVTEFGKSLVAKTAVVVAKIEDVMPEYQPQTASKSGATSHYDDSDYENDTYVTAITHTGADLFLRTAYCPDKFSHRILIASEDGDLKDASVDAGRTEITTIAGPLCFSGDVIASRVRLPRSIPGDRVVVLDAGANTLSLFSRHCSRQAPAVFAFRRIDNCDSTSVLVTCVKKEESHQDVINFWS